MRVRNRLSAAGCGFSILGRTAEDCGKLNGNLARMESNLDSLLLKRASMRPAKSTAQILDALDANGCREDRRMPQAVEAADQRIRTIEQILSQANANEPSNDNAEGERNIRRVLNPGEGVARLAGTYRTFCVRTCDGYYFPMSPASSRREFARDQKNCQAACPDAEMQVFYQDEDSGAAAKMISARTGSPYAGLPAAYRYRSASAPAAEGCSCNAPKNFEVIAGNRPQKETAEAASATVSTEADPTFSSSIVKPEPPAASQPSASVEETKQPETRTATADAPSPVQDADPDRRVRVVGPTFLPAPEEAINLRAPARRHVR
ncbi:DUF2865 domain-containing protein [Mesorhizobium sp. KR1-2]|uniref:DUF2865 domain-containing protein n=1 Tax=Mesorhizobium sp. KR1-2 TaxID=3156609 RepID=UPI0032B5DA26